MEHAAIIAPKSRADQRFRQALQQFVALAACVFVLALHDTVYAQRLTVRTIGLDSGLPGTDVACIVPDSYGFIWFCTSEGLARYDGSQFRTYGKDDGLPSAHVTALFQARDGVFWVGTSAGLARFAPSATPRTPGTPLFATVHSAPDSQDSATPLNRTVFPAFESSVRTLYQDRTGTIWCGTGSGLYQVSSDANGYVLQKLRVPVRQPVSVNAVLEDHAGRVWIGADSGLYRMDQGGRFVDFGDAGLLEPGANHNAIDALLETRDGRIFVGAVNGGLRLLRPDPSPGEQVTARKWLDVSGIRHDRAQHVIQAKDGSIWWVGLQGLRTLSLPKNGAWEDASLRQFTTREGLPATTYNWIAEDASGDLWLAGPSTDVVRVIRRGFETFTENDGLDTRRVRAITSDWRGTVIVVTERERGAWFHHRFDGHRFHPVRFNIPHDDWGWGWSQLTFQDPSGRWWLPTGQAVYRSAPGVEFDRLASTRLHKFPSPFPPQPFLRAGRLITDFADDPPELQAWAAFRLFRDSRGWVWAGTMQRVGGHDTPNELVRWDPDSDRFAPFANADRNFVPMSFAEDHEGGIWIGGYNGGLRRVTPDRSRLVDYTALASHGQIAALSVDHAGRLWVGSSDSGLLRIDSPSESPSVSRRFGTADGLASQDIRTIVESPDGRLFVGHAKGVDVVGVDQHIERNFTSADGLAAGPVWCSFVDREGSLWFGTSSGISRYSPSAASTRAYSARLLITDVQVAGRPLRLNDIGAESVPEFDVPAASPVVRIAFAAPGTGTDAGIRYQTRLDGGSGEWSAPTTAQSAEFAQLASGRYRLRVRVVTSGGFPSGDERSLDFTVLRPAWLQPWFVGLVGLAFGTMLYVLHRLRLRQAVAVERVRLRLARDLHDDLGATLARLAMLGEAASRDGGRAQQLVGEIAASARSLVGSLAEIVWFVDPQRDDLASVLELVAQQGRETFEPLGVAWSVDLSPGLSTVTLAPDARRDLFLLLKEAVTNAGRHARASRAGLSAALEDGLVVVVVWDNGRGGVDADSHDPKRGNGLANMAARANAIGATLDVQLKPSHSVVRVALPRG